MNLQYLFVRSLQLGIKHEYVSVRDTKLDPFRFFQQPRDSHRERQVAKDEEGLSPSI